MSASDVDRVPAVHLRAQLRHARRRITALEADCDALSVSADEMAREVDLSYDKGHDAGAQQHADLVAVIADVRRGIRTMDELYQAAGLS